jgi:hypothetical protein
LGCQFAFSVLQFNRLEIAMNLCKEWPIILSEATCGSIGIVDGRNCQSSSRGSIEKLASDCCRCFEKVIEIGGEYARGFVCRQQARKNSVSKGWAPNFDLLVDIGPPVSSVRIHRFKRARVLGRISRWRKNAVQLEESINAFDP